MSSETNNDMSDIQFTSLEINGYNYNVNREYGKDLQLLNSFTDLKPYYDEDNGLHMKLSTSNHGEIKRMPLNKFVSQNMIIKGAKEMNDTEYYQTLVREKSAIVDHMIKQTYACGFDKPSPAQSLSTLELVQGHDVLCQSKSGTGKTHTFISGTIYHFDPLDNQLQFLYITSSHEIALQIYNHVKFLVPENTKIALCIGQRKDNNPSSTGGFKSLQGTSSLGQKTKSLREERDEAKNAQIIVGTMGKIYDYIFNHKCINLTNLKTICVDEFDNIVVSDSKPKSSTSLTTDVQMAHIMKKIPHDTQRAFFSATISNAKRALQTAHSYFREPNTKFGEPFIVLLDIEDYTLEGIRQYYVQSHDFNVKKEILMDLLKQLRISQAIIFANKIDTANEIKYFLDSQEVEMATAVFHGGLSAVERKDIHSKFVQNKIRLLISTDLTARGLDVQSINLVINFDMPDSIETYIHSVGRSGRYGRKGVAISFIVKNAKMDEFRKVREIDECSKQSKMTELPSDLGNLL